MPTSGDITKALLVRLPEQFPCRCWRRNVMAAMLPGTPPRFVRSSALPGEADITGILRLPSGVGLRVEIEVKAGRDSQSEAQRVFERMITAHGGIYLIARDVEQTLAELRRIVDALSKTATN